MENIEKPKQKNMSDLDLLSFWIDRFKNLVNEEGNAAKDIYLEQAKKDLKREFADPVVKEMLEAEIKKYEA